MPENCHSGQQGELYWALPPIFTSEISCVSTSFLQGVLKLVLPLAVIPSVKPQIKTRRKKCEKIEGCAEKQKKQGELQPAQRLLVKSRDVDGKVSGNASLQTQMQPDSGKKSVSHFIPSSSIDRRINARKKQEEKNCFLVELFGMTLLGGVQYVIVYLLP